MEEDQTQTVSTPDQNKPPHKRTKVDGTKSSPQEKEAENTVISELPPPSDEFILLVAKTKVEEVGIDWQEKPKEIVSAFKTESLADVYKVRKSEGSHSC